MEAYLASPVLPGASPTFAFEPIFVHPGHGLDAPTWPESSQTPMDDQENAQLPSMSELDISDPAFSPARRGSDLSDASETDATPWFTESSCFGSYQWPSSSSISTMNTGFFERDSPSSSRSSTPTPESPAEGPKPQALDVFRSPPPLAPSSFFFNSASPHLRGSSRSRPPSPPPSHGGATMKRSFSLPVEAETVLQDRLSRRSSLHCAAIVMSPSLSRSPSSSGFGSGWMSPPASGIHSASSIPRRESAPSTTEGLGFSVPQPPIHLAFEAKTPLSTYPYNVASPKRSRLARSYSTPDVPSFHIPMSPIKSTASGSSSPALRPRRPTLDFKMTPISPTVANFASAGPSSACA